MEPGEMSMGGGSTEKTEKRPQRGDPRSQGEAMGSRSLQSQECPVESFQQGQVLLGPHEDGS